MVQLRRPFLHFLSRQLCLLRNSNNKINLSLYWLFKRYIEDIAFIRDLAKSRWRKITESLPVSWRFRTATNQLSLWRNRLARSAVNRKVGGSSPPRDEAFDLSFSISNRNTPLLAGFSGCQKYQGVVWFVENLLPKTMPRVRIELTTFRSLWFLWLWDWRATYCATEALLNR